MPDRVETLRPDQFQVFTGNWVPGPKILKEFAFDPARCTIAVDAALNMLVITQEGRNITLCVGHSRRWRRTP